MGYTKRDFVTGAFSEIGMADYVYDLTPDQLNDAMLKLDRMIAMWNGRGIRLGWPIPGGTDADLDEETDAPDSAWEAVTTNLAVRLAPGYGKQVMQETKTVAATSYNELIARSVQSPPMRFPTTLPLGAGNKPWVYDQPFFVEPVAVPDGGPDGPIDYGAGGTDGDA